MSESEWKAFWAGFNASAEGFNGECATVDDVEASVREKFDQWQCEHDWSEWERRREGNLPIRECGKCGDYQLGDLEMEV